MPDQPSPEKLEQLRDAIFARRKIEAIKLYREFSGSDLVDAKNYIEKLTSELETQHPEKFAPKPKGCSVAAVVLLLGFILLALVAKAHSAECAVDQLVSVEQMKRP